MFNNLDIKLNKVLCVLNVHNKSSTTYQFKTLQFRRPTARFASLLQILWLLESFGCIFLSCFYIEWNFSIHSCTSSFKDSKYVTCVLELGMKAVVVGGEREITDRNWTNNWPGLLLQTAGKSRFHRRFIMNPFIIFI